MAKDTGYDYAEAEKSRLNEIDRLNRENSNYDRKEAEAAKKHLIFDPYGQGGHDREVRANQIGVLENKGLYHMAHQINAAGGPQMIGSEGEGEKQAAGGTKSRKPEGPPAPDDKGGKDNGGTNSHGAAHAHGGTGGHGAEGHHSEGGDKGSSDHVVKSGQTLTGIATAYLKEHGHKNPSTNEVQALVEGIAVANHITNKNKISAGTQVHIPGDTSPPTQHAANNQDKGGGRGRA